MKNKNILSGLVALFAATSLCQMAQADVLLIDVSDNQGTPGSTAPWDDAGVTEDLTGSAGAQVAGNGTVSLINSLTVGVTGASTWNGGETGAASWNNGMLDDYMIHDANVASPVSISIGGFESTLTSTMTGVDGTFTLQPSSDYKIYLFGRGDATDQNTTFTLGGVAKTTTAGSAVETDHYVTYDFTTPADLTGYAVDFTFANDANSRFTGWNGAAIVAIPEPATLGLIGAFGGGLFFIRRRFLI